MGITRAELYQQVWAEPMTTVAARYGISSNYLARICQHLNLPHPARGYWAKLQFGKAPKRPALPDVRPGDATEWERGDWVPKPSEGHGRPAESPKATKTELPSRHALVSGAREMFEKARLTETGYLRPFKRNLVDAFVSQPTLPYALDTANELFLALELTIITGLNCMSTKGRRSSNTTTESHGHPEGLLSCSSAINHSASLCMSLQKRPRSITTGAVRFDTCA
jgi:hypothetical protein